MTDANHEEKNLEAGPEQNKANEPQVSILDFFIVLLNNAGKIIKTTIIFIILGALIAFLKPDSFQSDAKLIPDVQDPESMGASSLARIGRSFGLDIGDNMQGMGLTALAFPDILTSREVLHNVMHDHFYIAELDSTMALVDYLNYMSFSDYVKKYTIGLPFVIKKALLGGTDKESGAESEDILILNKEESTALGLLLKQYVSVDKDIETGILTITVTAPEAGLSAKLASRILKHFKDRVQRIYTQKAKEQLAFVQNLYDEAQAQLRTAENELAEFMLKNSNPQTARLQIELERLRRNVDFKASVFTEVQNRLTNAEIELKRSEPVITILEKPGKPLNPTGFGLKMLVILFLLIGLFVSIVWIYLGKYLSFVFDNPIDRTKLNNLKELLRSNRILRSFFK